MRAGLIGSRTEWMNRIGSGLGDDTARELAAATIAHFTAQLEAVDKAIAETIDQDAELRRRRELLLSVVGVGETLAGLLLAELPEPGVLRRSSEAVAYAGLNPATPIRHVDRPADADIEDRQCCAAVGTLHAGVGGDAIQPAVAALAARPKSAGRLKPKQVVVAAMRKLLVLCFGVLKTGKRFTSSRCQAQCPMLG